MGPGSLTPRPRTSTLRPRISRLTSQYRFCQNGQTLGQSGRCTSTVEGGVSPRAWWQKRL